MKSLKECLATPLDTVGIGNPMPATDTTIGSEPISTFKEKKNVRKKTNKKSIKRDSESGSSL